MFAAKRQIQEKDVIEIQKCLASIQCTQLKSHAHVFSLQLLSSSGYWQYVEYGLAVAQNDPQFGFVLCFLMIVSGYAFLAKGPQRLYYMLLGAS